MKKALLAVLLFGGTTMMGVAQAVTWSTSGADYACAAPCTFTSGTDQIKVRAYATPGPTGSDGSIAPTSGPNSVLDNPWVTAQMKVYTGGLGVHNGQAADPDDLANSSPEHAVDNDQLIDIVVYELPAANWKITQLGLGWIASNTGYDTSPEVDVWVGGTAATSVDFTNVCFSGCANSLENMGFSKTTVAFTGTGLKSVSASAGRFVVVTASMSSPGYEAFKINKIEAIATQPPSSVPEPGVLMLLAGGLFGLRMVNRSRKAS